MDQFFNEGVARDVFGIVSKMSDDEAEMFSRFVSYDVLMEDIENNKRAIGARVERIHKSLYSDISKRLDGPQAQAAAQLVSLVSKADDDEYDTNYERKYKKRQPRGHGGKWSKTTITISRGKDRQPSERDPSHVHAHTAADAKRYKDAGMEPPWRGDFDLTSALVNTGKETSAFSQRWHDPVDYQSSTNARMYNRISAGADVLSAMPSNKAKLAGQLGGFLGQYGPEAEKVIGPHMRRTAYRYRGTERRPDPKLAEANRQSLAATARNLQINQADMDDQVRTFAARNAAIRYLDGHLPNQKLAAIQAASGKIPPSEGVIINADGQIITQAVGFMDDHYLPFNLKNLKGLQGGSYVRTRATGGLTTEDIYTGLLSGARSVTVISRSGQFTINFDDDLRGGRRYSDKAAQMVTRYAKTLDAIKSEQVSRTGLKPEERAAIREEVERDMPPEYYTQREILKEIKRKEDEYKSQPTLNEAEIKEINDKARSAAEQTADTKFITGRDSAGKPQRITLPASEEARFKIFRSQMLDEAQQEKQRNKWRLDGEGYAVALDALREQFPYFIDQVQYIHRNDESEFGRSRTNETDTGYVKPRYLRPEGALEGYFDTSINGAGSHAKGKTGKVTADRTNYANWSHNPERAAGRLRPVGEEATGEEKEAEGNGKRAKEKLREAISLGQARANADKAMVSLVQHYGPHAGAYDKISEAHALVKRGGDLGDKLSDPTYREELENELREADSTAAQSTDEAFKRVHATAKGLWSNYEAQRTLVAGAKFNRAEWQQRMSDSPIDPYTFDDDKAYSLNQDPKVYQDKFDELAQKVKAANGRVPDMTWTDTELRDKAVLYGGLADRARRAIEGKPVDANDLGIFMGRYKADPTFIAASVDRLRDPESAQRMARASAAWAENYERMRRIKLNAEAKNKGKRGNGVKPPAQVAQQAAPPPEVKTNNGTLTQIEAAKPAPPKPAPKPFEAHEVSAIAQRHANDMLVRDPSNTRERDGLEMIVSGLGMTKKTQEQKRRKLIEEGYSKLSQSNKDIYHPYLTGLGYDLSMPWDDPRD